MHITATSLEDLIKKQGEYGNALRQQCKYDKILTGCNNPILAGYLYYRCMNLEEYKISVDYDVRIDTAECRLALYELIEILGIFLTNAEEASQEDEGGNKQIALSVTEDKDHLYMEVGNPSPFLTVERTETLFQKGVSSKGENRGIGLFRVKQLAEKSKADIIVENRTEAEKNWVFFKMIIPN